MIRCCPTCGRKLSEKFGPHGLTWNENVIFSTVEAAGKRGISSPDLLAKLYQDRANGGPLFARECMYQAIHRLNRKIAATGRQIGRKTKTGVTGIYVLREKGGGPCASWS